MELVTHQIQVTRQNANGKDLISVCQSYDMVPLNRLEHH